jgi:MFS family permease
MALKKFMARIMINRDFGFLWSGQAISTFGNFFLFLALPIMTYNITGSMTTLGITISLQALPAIIAGPFAGALADRWDRKKTMIISDLIRALLLVPIIFVNDSSLLYVIFAVSFFLSLVGFFFEPAYGAALPRIAGKDNVLKANSLIQTSISIIKILAPLAGAGFLTIAGPQVMIVIDILSFIISAVTILLIKCDISVKNQDRISFASIVNDIKDGICYIAKRNTVIIVLVAFLFLAFFEGIIEVLMLPYVKDILKVGEQGYGLGIAVQGAGQILGSIIIGVAGKKVSTKTLFIFCFISLGLLSIPFVNLNSFPLVALVLCLIGIVVVGFFISTNTIIQTEVEDQFMGRVQNSLNILFQLGMLATTFLAGLTSEVYGVRFILNIGAAIEVVGGIIVFIMLKSSKVKSRTTKAEPLAVEPNCSSQYSEM